MKALLALEDGKVFSGYSFGSAGEAQGEVVFNTSLTGYQEALTDPSYRGQIVTMTYPLVGNYGVNLQDVESSRLQVGAFVVRENSPGFSNYRATGSLETYLKENGIVALERIDTRALTKHIREKGAMRGVISTEDLDPSSLIEKARKVLPMVGQDLVQKVTTSTTYTWSDQGRFTILVVDCGVKYNILRELARRNCRVVVCPANISLAEIENIKPQGVLFPNGPGDPAAVPYVVDLARAVMKKYPTFGICFGHQVLCRALGAETFKLKFGHRGDNHPVKELSSGQVFITSQNHGFVVAADTLPPEEVEVTYINLNDHTLEGIKHRYLPLFSVQFHPEARPGPHDTNYLFDYFVKMVEDNLA